MPKCFSATIKSEIQPPRSHLASSQVAFPLFKCSFVLEEASLLDIRVLEGELLDLLSSGRS